MDTDCIRDFESAGREVLSFGTYILYKPYRQQYILSGGYRSFFRLAGLLRFTPWRRWAASECRLLPARSCLRRIAMKKNTFLPSFPRIKTVVVRPHVRIKQGQVELVKPYLRSTPRK